jgi:hypothetical protein
MMYQITNPALSPSLQNMLSSSNSSLFFEKIIPVLIGVGLIIGILIFLVIFLMGAIMWIMSGDDKNKFQQAKDRITQALIGLIILFSTFAVLKSIEIITGTDLIRLNLGFIVIR